jgi:NADPH:quinone reductase and related Zn-dependent oxidoreductases
VWKLDGRLCRADGRQGIEECAVAGGVAFETAATVWHNYGTAYYALVEGARAQHGETVFVTGAAGGVGLAAVDLAGHLGLRVVAGVGSDDKAGLGARLMVPAMSSTIGAKTCASGSSR